MKNTATGAQALSSITSGSFNTGLTSLNAARLAGTVPAAALPAIVVTNGGPAVSLSGTFFGAFSGDGSRLVNVGNGSGTPIATLPYTITAPGRYFLAKNLTAIPMNPAGIVIAANDVSPDRNGFSLVGNYTDTGVSVSYRSTNVLFQNGTLRNWSSWAVMALNAVASRFVNLQVFDSDGGIAAGRSCQVNNAIDANVGFGWA